MPISPIHTLIDTYQEQVEMIYIGYFGRAGDPGGVEFWMESLLFENTIEDVARDFANQQEAKDLYPFLALPALNGEEWRRDFIKEIYNNLFNREPDQGGEDYWETVLEGYQAQYLLDGDEQAFYANVGGFILEVIRGATNGPAGQDITTLINKVEVAECFTNHVAGLGPNFYVPPNPPEIDQIAHDAVDETDADTDVELECLEVELEINEFLNIGETFTLTPGADRVDGNPSFLGTDQNDTYNAYVTMTNFLPLQTLNNEDWLDGAGGYDILNVMLWLDVVPEGLFNIEEIRITAITNIKPFNDVDFDLNHADSLEVIRIRALEVGDIDLNNVWTTLRELWFEDMREYDAGDSHQRYWQHKGRPEFEDRECEPCCYELAYIPCEDIPCEANVYIDFVDGSLSGDDDHLDIFLSRVSMTLDLDHQGDDTYESVTINSNFRTPSTTWNTLELTGDAAQVTDIDIVGNSNLCIFGDALSFDSLRNFDASGLDAMLDALFYGGSAGDETVTLIGAQGETYFQLQNTEAFQTNITTHDEDDYVNICNHWGNVNVVLGDGDDAFVGENIYAQSDDPDDLAEVVVDGGDGDDDLIFRNIQGNVVAIGGAGLNTFLFSDIEGTVTATGGSGDDVFCFQGDEGFRSDDVVNGGGGIDIAISHVSSYSDDVPLFVGTTFIDVEIARHTGFLGDYADLDVDMADAGSINRVELAGCYSDDTDIDVVNLDWDEVEDGGDVIALRSSVERLSLNNAALSAGAFNLEIGDPCGEAVEQCDFSHNLGAYLSWQVGAERVQIGDEREFGTDDNMTLFLNSVGENSFNYIWDASETDANVELTGTTDIIIGGVCTDDFYYFAGFLGVYAPETSNFSLNFAFEHGWYLRGDSLPHNFEDPTDADPSVFDASAFTGNLYLTIGFDPDDLDEAENMLIIDGQGNDSFAVGSYGWHYEKEIDLSSGGHDTVYFTQGSDSSISDSTNEELNDINFIANFSLSGDSQDRILVDVSSADSAYITHCDAYTNQGFDLGNVHDYRPNWMNYAAISDDASDSCNEIHDGLQTIGLLAHTFHDGDELDLSNYHDAAIDYNFIQFTTGEASDPDGAPGETMEEFFNALMGGGHIDLAIGAADSRLHLLASGYSNELGAMVLFVIENDGSDSSRIDASDSAYAITAVDMTWEEYIGLDEDDMADLIGFYNSNVASQPSLEGPYGEYKECDDCSEIIRPSLIPDPA